MRKDQARALGDLHCVQCSPFGLARPAEQRERRALLGVPDALDRSDLRRLVLERVEPVHVARDDLQRDRNRRSNDGRAQRLVRARRGRLAQDLPGADTGHEEGGSQRRGQQFVREPVGERGIEDDVPPAQRMELAVDDLEAGRRLHPRVEAENPEGRHGGAEGHEKGGDQVHALGDTATAEQHDAQEGRFKKESREDLIAEQWPRDVARLLHEARPVGAELEAHGDARHDA